MNRLSTIVVSIIIGFASCGKDRPLFDLVSSTHSGITFSNKIVENDSLNPFDVTNIYNGAGVAIGDFNNDGLQDIYFPGNQVPCKLYLNKGNFKFRDVTTISQVDGNKKWCRGVAVVDINDDGLLDIYVCATIDPHPVKRENLLYVNQGLNDDGVPVFKEMAAEYGLNDNSHSTMAYFFDYDNDRDLDVYIVVNEIRENENPSVYRPILKDGSSPSTGRLYRNDFDPGLRHPVFTNVSHSAGITIEGYGHSASIADINDDGWKDIFVANDFLSNDILYINNRDGTFTDKSAIYFKHTSANGMGSDIIDINNDGLADLIEVDMDPEDNLRKKILMSGYNYQNYINNEIYGYQYQYVRNTLQLNQGNRLVNDTFAEPVFSEIGYYSGISSTDWSWAPIVQDFDNDGLRDLIVTNGFPKDITDHDFIAFRQKSFGYASKKEVLSKIPEQKIANYAFKNNGEVTFKDVSTEWGLEKLSFSNGGAYADLDNDGDLDIVISNINEEAFIYENTTDENRDGLANYINIKISGGERNRNGIGATVEVHTDKIQSLENSPHRGYLSTMQNILHFGIGKADKVDSLVIDWPGNKRLVLRDVKINSTVLADYNKATSYDRPAKRTIDSSLFKRVTGISGIDYKHKEQDFVDFNVQKLLPHKFSEYSPALASGDINNDGFDDIIVGGSVSYRTTAFLQRPDGSFVEKTILADVNGKKTEDVGICLFDPDNDGDMDMYLASGSNEYAPGSLEYTDRLLINDGKGNFIVSKASLPANTVSKSCVRPADFDNDGDIDLFVAGRLLPWNYPKPVKSFIYRNDSRNGQIKFVDVTDSSAPGSLSAGLICDALWTDFDNDGWKDLLVAGEWDNLLFLKNKNGQFHDISHQTRLDTLRGLWNSLAAGDFDNDGDVDFIAGNLGFNSFYSSQNGYPLSIYFNDFYKQGTVQCIVTKYMKDKPGGTFKEFTTHSRDDVVEQLPFIKKRFLTYRDFGMAPFDKVFTPGELASSSKMSANYFPSVMVRNDGEYKFSFHPLPKEAQYSSLNGMVIDDFDGDGNLDVCINTNDYSTDPANGRYDALNGLLIKGNGDGTFTSMSPMQSGIFIPGNGKALVKLQNARSEYLLAGTQNRGTLELFQLRNNRKSLKLNPGDVKAEITLRNGTKRIHSFSSGGSMSQSAEVICIPFNAVSIKVETSNGRIREMLK